MCVGGRGIGYREYRDEKSTKRMGFERGVERMGSGCDGDGTFPIDLAILSTPHFTPSHPFCIPVDPFPSFLFGCRKDWEEEYLDAERMGRRCRKDGEDVKWDAERMEGLLKWGCIKEWNKTGCKDVGEIKWVWVWVVGGGGE